ncbi:MAG: hypothetical protein E8D45_04085 [Nitrospira sp.]|nr:MAG: hypothetical protein E8D45_04085 [Nitrospira sp.]
MEGEGLRAAWRKVADVGHLGERVRSIIRTIALVVLSALTWTEPGVAQSILPSAGRLPPWMLIQQAEQTISDRERAGLRGSVVKVVEARTSGPAAVPTQGTEPITTTAVEYDERGFEVLREEYREWNGELMRTLQLSRDPIGRVTEVTEELWGMTRAPEFFGHIGRVGETSEFLEAQPSGFDGPTQTIRKRVRYEADRVVEVEVADTAVGAEVDRRLYEYDPSRQQVRVYSSNDQGEFVPANVSEYRLRANGAIERVTTYSLYGSDRAIYDAQGRLREETAYRGKAGMPRSSRRYDSAGREVERVEYDRAGTSRTRRENSYDAEGRLAESIVRYAAEESVRRRYQYTVDAQGNWIRRVSTAFEPGPNDHPRTETVERIITYAAPPEAPVGQTADAKPTE